MKWTTANITTLRRLYPDMDNEVIARRMGRTYASVMQMAIKLGLRKGAEFMKTCRFPKGHKPWNAGKKGWQAGGAARLTQFKKGSYSPRWNREDYPVGALRINSDNVLAIKLADGEWETLARYVWETERGPIPAGGVIRFRNGDPHDTRLSNLRLATRLDLMRQNSVHNLPKDLQRLVQLRAVLNRQINKRDHGKRH